MPSKFVATRAGGKEKLCRPKEGRNTGQSRTESDRVGQMFNAFGHIPAQFRAK